MPGTNRRPRSLFCKCSHLKHHNLPCYHPGKRRMSPGGEWSPPALNAAALLPVPAICSLHTSGVMYITTKCSAGYGSVLLPNLWLRLTPASWQQHNAVERRQAGRPAASDSTDKW